MKIYNKIRIIFVVAILFVTAFFGAFTYIQQQQHLKQIRMRYIQTSLYISRYLRLHQRKIPSKNLLDKNLRAFLKESDFSLVKKRELITNILKHGHTLQQRKILRKNRIKIIRYHRRLYLFFGNKNRSTAIMLKDNTAISLPWISIFGYFGALTLLGGLYLWLIQSLRPLRMLRYQIEQIGSGDLSISTKSDANDEIGAVANTLDGTLRKLESMIHSRQLFLRSIMHELKTPIAKGRLLNEFLQNSHQKKDYDAIFERLELLIEEFAKIEQMLSSNYTLKLADYHAIDIIEQSLELMMLNEDEIKQKIIIHRDKEYKLNTDFDLLSLAIKNLIDNAIKYSDDHKAIVTINDNAIAISNRSKRFTDNIEEYTKPFHDQKHGLGLGLYIVWQIMDMLFLDLEYKYEDKHSIFKITKCAKYHNINTDII